MPDAITNESASEVAGRPVDLAHAAHYSTKLIDAMAKAFPVESIVDLLLRLSTAKTYSKSGTEYDDCRTQLAAATLLLNYVVGRPVERQEIVNVNLDADASVGIDDRLRKSPALRESLKRAIEKAEGGAAVEV
jgi:hypothetical protein